MNIFVRVLFGLSIIAAAIGSFFLAIYLSDFEIFSKTILFTLYGPIENITFALINLCIGAALIILRIHAGKSLMSFTGLLVFIVSLFVCYVAGMQGLFALGFSAALLEQFQKSQKQNSG